MAETSRVRDQLEVFEEELTTERNNLAHSQDESMLWSGRSPRHQVNEEEREKKMEGRV